jgi:predicted nucleic acid-binding Zn ribbon protein
MSTWRPTPDESEPRPVSESLDRITRRMGAPTTSVLTVVFTRWAEIVGPELADHARPESLRSGILTLVADDPAWAAQLRFLAAEIVARIGTATGPSDVVEVRVKVRRS